MYLWVLKIVLQKMFNKEKYESDKACIDILKYIFHDYSELFDTIAPNGWENSQYVRFLHPTPEQSFKEYKRMSENIDRLFEKKSKKGKKEQEKTLADFQKENDENKEIKIKPVDEVLYILGLATYDVFSNNHEVISPNNKVYDLGSLRGSGHFIADFLNYNFEFLSQKYDYLNFYMGTIWIESRADLTPFYVYIFQNLKEKNCNWKYFFPRMFLIDPKDYFNTEDDKKPEDYDPNKAILEEIEQKKKEDEKQKFQDELDEIYKESYENAKYTEPSKLVLAYKKVFGELPEGHPQKK